jgi:hypothetical protein
LSATDPFEHLRPDIVQVPDPKARALFAAVIGSELPRAGLDRFLRVRDLTTIRCDAYARILHALQVTELDDRRVHLSHWRELLPGQPVGSDTMLFDVFEHASDHLRKSRIRVDPLIGTLDKDTAKKLATSVLRWSQTADCYFYYWGGYGISSDQQNAIYEGRVDFVDRFTAADKPLYQSPTLWWSADRSWFIGTYVESTSTYVGGSRELIKAILQDSELETTTATELTVIDDWTAQRK